MTAVKMRKRERNPVRKRKEKLAISPRKG